MGEEGREKRRNLAEWGIGRGEERKEGRKGEEGYRSPPPLNLQEEWLSQRGEGRWGKVPF